MLKESLLLPIKYLNFVMIFFWPFLIIFIMMVVATKSIYFYNLLPRWPPNDNYAFYAMCVFYAKSILTLYSFLLLCRGFVFWHRKIVTGRDEKYFPFLIDGRDLKYFFYFIGIALILIIGSLLAAYAPSYALFNNLPNHQVHGFSFIVIIMLQLIILWDLVVVAFAGFFITFILRNSILLLPGIAVGDDTSRLKENVLINHQRKSNWRRNLFICSSVISFVFLLEPLNYRRNSMAVVITHEILIGIIALYSGLVLASLLSLYYRDHIKPEYDIDVAQ